MRNIHTVREHDREMGTLLGDVFNNLLSVCTTTRAFSTKGQRDTKHLTHAMANAVEESGLYNGVEIVFVPGSTAGIATIEFESGAVEDLSDAFERIAPKDRDDAHNERCGDMNGFGHARAAMLGLSVTIPSAKRRLLLGTWQQVVLVDFDNRARNREVLVQVMGE